MVEKKRSAEKHEGMQKFSNDVRDREARKLHARKHCIREVWFGLGMFGIIGWAIAIPTILGGFIGIWLDLNRKGRFSWALMLLLIGLALGCWNAWYWVQRERRSITKWKENRDE
ncbi:MAG: AtpZ/AtpI family protein [Thermodesulfobacteriota bacterium]|nr:AtpZ/AtpI family protein [Thermodesulfobacteriota bacterium]